MFLLKSNHLERYPHWFLFCAAFTPSSICHIMYIKKYFVVHYSVGFEWWWTASILFKCEGTSKLWTKSGCPIAYTEGQQVAHITINVYHMHSCCRAKEHETLVLILKSCAHVCMHMHAIEWIPKRNRCKKQTVYAFHEPSSPNASKTNSAIKVVNCTQRPDKKKISK